MQGLEQWLGGKLFHKTTRQQALTELGLVDEYQIFVAAKFLGSTARPLLELPLTHMSEAPLLKITEMRAVGDDWRVTAIPVPSASV